VADRDAIFLALPVAVAAMIVVSIFTLNHRQSSWRSLRIRAIDVIPSSQKRLYNPGLKATLICSFSGAEAPCSSKFFNLHLPDSGLHWRCNPFHAMPVAI